MDAILNSNTAWEILSGPEVNDIKETECANAFLTLLTTISDRYKHLPQPGHRYVRMIFNIFRKKRKTVYNSVIQIKHSYRLQFLELQLELIDDWRVRLLQLLHEDCVDPLASLMPRILNTLHYVANVLEEWGVTVVCIPII